MESNAYVRCIEPADATSSKMRSCRTRKDAGVGGPFGEEAADSVEGEPEDGDGVCESDEAHTTAIFICALVCSCQELRQL